MATNIVSPFSRRNFLAAGAGIITGSIFSPFSIALGKPKERLGIALVGLGYYSTDLLAPALQKTKNCSLADIVTGMTEKAET